MNRYVYGDVSQIHLTGREFGEKVMGMKTNIHSSSPYVSTGDEPGGIRIHDRLIRSLTLKTTLTWRFLACSGQMPNAVFKP